MRDHDPSGLTEPEPPKRAYRALPRADRRILTPPGVEFPRAAEKSSRRRSVFRRQPLGPREPGSPPERGASPPPRARSGACSATSSRSGSSSRCPARKSDWNPLGGNLPAAERSNGGPVRAGPLGGMEPRTKGGISRNPRERSGGAVQAPSLSRDRSCVAGRERPCFRSAFPRRVRR